MKIPFTLYWSLFSTYLKPRWRRVLLLAVLLFAGIGLQIVNPQVVRYFIDTARAGGSVDLLVAAALVFIGVVVLQQGLLVVASWASESLAWLATNALRRDLAAHCLALDMHFHNTHTPGEMIERIDGDVTAMANFFSEFVLQVLGNLLLMTGVLIVLFAVDWRIGLAMTAYATIALFGIVRLRGISLPHWVAGRQASAEMAGFLEERLAGTEDIRSSRATDFVMGQFYRVMRDIYLTYRRAFLTGALGGTMAFFSFSVGMAIALGIGGYLYLHGQISLGTVFATGYYADIISWPLFEVTNQINDFQQASAGVARVAQLRATPIGIQDGPGRALPSGTPAVEFREVSFGYQPEEPVLDNVTFTVQPGEVLGLLGRTGSGKTTISRLLFRLYEPQRGTVQLAGVDIRELRLADLRRRIGLVTQEVQLFHASVRDNLTFFNRAVPDERVLQAIEGLGLESWYRSLPDGLDTQLTGSSALSAGEAQVLALTRVFLKDPDVVILDEASSRLDPATELLIEHAVDALLRGRTAIVIAHRLATVQRAGSIMILSGGRIVEYGPRAALAADPTSHFAGLLRTGLEDRHSPFAVRGSGREDATGGIDVQGLDNSA